MALGGADAITVGDLSGSAIRQANIDLSQQGTGDRQADRVTVTGTAAADMIKVDADGADLDQLQINALDGDDAVDIGDGSATLIGISVDLGPGQP